jgi:FkbM family methyltransferase
MNMHCERLQLLKQKGFYPRVIYDVGAFRGEWSKEIKKIFPDSCFFLFEANKNNEPYLRGQGFPFFIELLGNEEKNVIFYSIDGTGDSVFKENTHYYNNKNVKKSELQMKTLSSVVKKNAIALPDLIKIDVQGAENIIIEGSEATILHAEVIILETKILEYNEKSPLIYETLDIMHRLGYQMSDIIEHHYLPSLELNEIDVLFIKNESKLIKTGILF